MLSPISLVEVIYLSEKNRVPRSAMDDLQRAFSDPRHVLFEAPLTSGVVLAMNHVPRAHIPDMPDRIIAATALHLGVPLISGDGRIRASEIETIW